MNADDPSAVVTSLFEAMKRKRWRRVARLMHPELPAGGVATLRGGAAVERPVSRASR